MKRLSIVFFAAFFAVSNLAEAQNSRVTSAWNYLHNKELDKAQKAIDEAIQNEDTKNEPKTWLYRGQIYQAAASSPTPEAAAIRNSKDVLSEALMSYKRCIELEAASKKDRYSQDAAMALQALNQEVFKVGADAYNKQNFDLALNKFSAYLDYTDVLAKYVKRNIIDTSTLFFAGYSALHATKPDIEKAKVYLEKAASVYSTDANVYLALSDIYKDEKNMDKALDILSKGMLSAKDKKSILLARLNIYIAQGQNDKAIEEGKKAIAADPKNISIYLALGTVYQNLKRPAEAEELYKQALAKDPENFTANNLIGINYYNIGVESYNKAVEEKDMKKSDKLDKEAKEVWAKAVPYLEKAYQKNPDDTQNANVLAEIYAKTDQLDKTKVIKDRMKTKKP